MNRFYPFIKYPNYIELAQNTNIKVDVRNLDFYINTKRSIDDFKSKFWDKDIFYDYNSKYQSLIRTLESEFLNIQNKLQSYSHKQLLKSDLLLNYLRNTTIPDATFFKESDLNGLSENYFLQHLISEFPNKIFVNLTFTRNLYKPDYVLWNQDINLLIDIEIDEPYTLFESEPVHYVGGIDEHRDSFFLENGWFVIRFAEEQIVKQTNECVRFIRDVYDAIIYANTEKLITNDFEYPTIVRRWTKEESKRLESQKIRQQYLKDLKIQNSTINKDTVFNNLNLKHYSKPHQIIRDNYKSTNSIIKKFKQSEEKLIKEIDNHYYEKITENRNNYNQLKKEEYETSRKILYETLTLHFFNRQYKYNEILNEPKRLKPTEFDWIFLERNYFTKTKSGSDIIKFTIDDSIHFIELVELVNLFVSDPVFYEGNVFIRCQRKPKRFSFQTGYYDCGCTKDKICYFFSIEGLCLCEIRRIKKDNEYFLEYKVF